MDSWRQYPILRLIVPFLTGIITAIKFNGHPLVLIWVITPVFLLFLVMRGIMRPLAYRNRWIPGVIIYFLLFLILYQLTLDKQIFGEASFAGPLKSSGEIYLGEIIEQPVQKTKNVKVVIGLKGVRWKGGWKKISDRVLVYFRNDWNTGTLFYGDRIVFYSELTEPPDPVTPFMFNYKQFLTLRGIRLQAFVKENHWRRIGRNSRNPLVTLAISFRNQLLGIFRDNQVRGKEFAVGSALLLGYVDEIDQELMKDYSATGAMHILSVSGMHVGIIFLVLEKMLLFLRRYRHGVIIKTGLVILFVWFYALLTGLSPSVMRAAAMLSLISIGNSMKRTPDVLNTMAASALFLLIWNPFLLIDAGFQLSYLAVAGIVLLYKPVQDIITPANWLMRQVWSILAVSFVAQLLTFPLSLFYFHQFPNYFMLTNIFVVPLSSLIIYAGILLLLLGSIPGISLIISKVFVFLIWLLNNSIHFIEELPFSTTKGIFIGVGEMLLLYSFILFFSFYLFTKKKLFIYISLLSLLIFVSVIFSSKLINYTHNKVIIYQLSHQTTIEFIQQGTSIIVGDKIVNQDEYALGIIHQTRLALGIKEKFRMLVNPFVKNDKPFRYENFFKEGTFVIFSGKRIALLNSKLPDSIPLKIKVDLLVICGNPSLSLINVMKIFKAGKVIVDGSNSSFNVEQWLKEARTLHLDIYSTWKSGAYIWDL
ncbi:MAG: ComEC/Rec2 family competence protein [Bacteroidetes bacterium]|nr:ComEC/Rec2 family competence protein [Bacteroidota bacterium]